MTLRTAVALSLLDLSKGVNTSQPAWVLAPSLPKQRRAKAINQGNNATIDRKKQQNAATNQNDEKEKHNPTLKQTRQGPRWIGSEENVERSQLITTRTTEDDIDLFPDEIECMNMSKQKNIECK